MALRLHLALATPLLLAALAFAADNVTAPAPARQVVLCEDCGVIHNIRRLERPVAPERRLLPDVAYGSREGATGKPTQTVPLFVIEQDSGPRWVKPDPITRSTWEITVRYDNGSFGFVTVDAEPDFVVGDRVRLVENVLEPIGPGRH